EFALPGKAEFSYEEDVERRVDCIGNFGRHGHAAPGQSEDDGVVVGTGDGTLFGENAAGASPVLVRTVGGHVAFHPAAGRYLTNHWAARSATVSNALCSSKRWVAPGTISSRFVQRSWANACSLSGMTGSSSPPTMRSVGASTRGRASRARSGRPPRETIAA